MNTIHLVGNVGKDCELTYTPQGTAVAKFSLADSQPSKPGSEKVTTWFNIILWDKLAESAGSLVKKGAQVYIVGRFTPRSYTTKEGKQGTSLDVTAQTFLLLGPKAADANAPAPAPSGDAPKEEFPF